MTVPQRPPGTEGNVLMDEVMLRLLRKRCQELHQENRVLRAENARLAGEQDNVTMFHGLEAA